MSAPDLLVCSHRGPYIYERTREGFAGRRGGGGLIGAVAPVLDRTGGTWIAAAMGEGDRDLAHEHPRGYEEGSFRLRFLDLPEGLHALHYDVVSNEYLWFLFHYLFDVPNAPVFDDDFAPAWDAYRSVNELYADAVVDARAEVVMVEDYHLMLVARLVRRKSKAHRPLVYFHHTPWCDPSYFSLLPAEVGREILESMLHYDVVGFHARRWADAFRACCERFVKGATSDGDVVRWGRRTTRLLVAPVPIDNERLTEQATGPEVQGWVERHDEMRAGRKLLLRVDRIDLSKNPLRGFLAFETLLDRRPSLAKEVVFLALLYPSRLSVESYRRYFADCLGVVRRINDRFERKTGTGEGPVHFHYEDDFERSLGAMRIYDALLVNPVFDGLNLVVKESAAVNERDGSAILSENAGAYEELRDAVIPVNPFDVSATADAIEKALERPAAARRRDARKLRRLATRSSPDEWVAARLAAAGL